MKKHLKKGKTKKLAKKAALAKEAAAPSLLDVVEQVLNPAAVEEDSEDLLIGNLFVDPLLDSSSASEPSPNSTTGSYLFSRTEDNVASVLNNLYFKRKDSRDEELFQQKVDLQILMIIDLLGNMHRFNPIDSLLGSFDRRTWNDFPLPMRV